MSIISGITFSLSIGYVKSYSSPYEQVRRDLETKDLYPAKPIPVCGDMKIEIFTKQLTKVSLLTKILAFSSYHQSIVV